MTDELKTLVRQYVTEIVDEIISNVKIKNSAKIIPDSKIKEVLFLLESTEMDYRTMSKNTGVSRSSIQRYAKKYGLRKWI